MEMEEITRSTAGHSLGMNKTELLGTGVRTRGAFDLGGNQEASRNYPPAPTAINMQDMMERKWGEGEKGTKLVRKRRIFFLF
jgi:hypothetical protein